jgi:hypothetical protein
MHKCDGHWAAEANAVPPSPPPPPSHHQPPSTLPPTFSLMMREGWWGGCNRHGTQTEYQLCFAGDTEGLNFETDAQDESDDEEGWKEGVNRTDTRF